MAEAKYRITAEDKSKQAVDSASQNMDRLGNATKKLGGLMAGALAAVSFKAIIDGVNQLTDLYGEQQQAELRLQQAVENNPYLNGDASRRLAETASSMQSMSIFGDEEIIQYQAMLASLQMTEDQINNVMSAAINLASSGMMSLEASVRNLSRTYSGMTGELGEAVPALRELTAEELRAGEGVELVNEAFAGMGEAVTQGIQGAQQQFENLAGDIGEQVGAIFGVMRAGLIEDLTPVLEGLSQWFEDNDQTIYAVFANIPEILREGFELVRNMMQTLFSWEGISQLVINMVNGLVNAFRIGFNMIRNIWETTTIGIRSIFTQLFASIRDTFTNWFDDFIGQFMNTFTWLQRQDNERVRDYISRVFSQEAPEYAPPEDRADPWATFRLTVATAFGSIFRDNSAALAAAIGEHAANLADTAEGVMGIFADEVASFRTNLNEILQAGEAEFEALTVTLTDTEEAAADLSSAIGVTYRGFANINPKLMAFYAGLGTITTSLVESDKKEGGGISFGQNTMSILFGQVSNGLIKLAGPVGWLAEMMLDLVSQIESVSAILNFSQTILSGFINTIGPVVNEVLAPVVGLLQMLGNVLGQLLVPIILSLSPIIRILGEAFLWLYNNVIRHFGNLIIGIGNILYDLVAAMANIVIGIHDVIFPRSAIGAISMRDVKTGFLEEVSYSQLEAAGGGVIGASTGGGVSYTQARDINIVINVEPGAFIVGENGMRTFSQMVRDEIRTIESMGY